jgi:uncharacterized protein YecT (DUF1311 family)
MKLRTWCAAAALVLLTAQGAFAQAPADTCAGAGTQKQLSECAYEAFLAATAEYSAAYKALSDKLAKDDVRQLQRTQKAWMAYRTATCDFEARGVQGGSAAAMVQWQCAARYTRVRTSELKKIAACPEGDLGCPALRR